MIPKIIHQIWFQGQREITNPYHRYCQSLWKQQHPGWTYWLWDAKAIEQLVASQYPEFRSLYEAYPLMIERIDVAKYFILEQYGGFYMDIDIECKKSLASLRKHELMVAQIHMTPIDIFLFTFNQVKRGPFINNAAIASIPGHPFWRHLIGQLNAYRRKKWYYTREYYVSASTGPQFFTRMVQTYSFGDGNKVLVAPPEYFEPNSLTTKESARAVAPFGIHRHDNTWLTWVYRSLKQLRYGVSGIRKMDSHLASAGARR